MIEKVTRAARMVRNTRTCEFRGAKATAVPRFRAGTDLKAYVSGAKKLPKPSAKKAASTSTAKAAPAKSPATKTAKAPAKAAAVKKAPAKKSSARR